MGEITRPKSDGTYMALLDFMNRESLTDKGDILEIGAFCGNFTRLLADTFKNRMVYAVDVFQPDYDKVMGDLYVEWLAGTQQLVEYQRNIAGLKNVVTLMCDSTLLPNNVRFSNGIKIAYIDGGHSYEAVRIDFAFAWVHLKANGLMVIDDYAHDLPDVTRAVDEGMNHLLSAERNTKYWHLPELKSFAVRKEPRSDN